jgi:ATP-dependent phosphofructokinase / diphosphate-dependent phosphofructokinase
MVKLKGNLVVGQSGGPTAVINHSVCGVVQEAMRHGEIGQIYGMHHGIQGFLQEDLFDLRKESPALIEGLRRTPSAALGSCRYKLQQGDIEKILHLCQAYDIRYFLYAGGGDTMDTVHQLSQAAAEHHFELRCIGVPKTIDNDLGVTDHCPGFGSAARFEVVTCMEIVRDTLALRYTETVKILETMGRNTGWLTASTALAGDFAPDLIYLPERAFDLDRFLGDIDRVYRQKGTVVIAACENLKFANGSYVAINEDPLNVDAFGHPEPGGIGHYLTNLVMKELRLKTRYEKPGTMQRCSGRNVSPVDSQEAYQVGKDAVAWAVQGHHGFMVTLERRQGEPYRCTTGMAPLEQVANLEKQMPADYISADGTFVTSEFVAYARPLIGPDLPDYVTLAGHPAAKP